MNKDGDHDIDLRQMHYQIDTSSIHSKSELNAVEKLNELIKNAMLSKDRDRDKDNTGPKICSDIETWMKKKPGIEWQYLWDGKEWKTYKTEYQY